MLVIASVLAAGAYAMWLRSVIDCSWASATTMATSIPAIAAVAVGLPGWAGLPYAAVGVLAAATAGAWALNAPQAGR